MLGLALCENPGRIQPKSGKGYPVTSKEHFRFSVSKPLRSLP